MALGTSAAVVRGFRTLFGAGAVGVLSDEQLVERFARGGEAAAAGAFEAIVARHGPMVLGVCRRVLRDEHDADDAFQATFLVLARKAGRLGRPERLACWLYGVAYRVARRAGRRRAATGPRGAAGRHDAPAPEAADAAHDLRPVLDAELARLPARYRDAIVLHDLEGRSVAEDGRGARRGAGDCRVAPPSRPGATPITPGRAAAWPSPPPRRPSSRPATPRPRGRRLADRADGPGRDGSRGPRGRSPRGPRRSPEESRGP